MFGSVSKIMFESASDLKNLILFFCWLCILCVILIYCSKNKNSILKLNWGNVILNWTSLRSHASMKCYDLPKVGMNVQVGFAFAGDRRRVSMLESVGAS